jgi:hypothetical protein
MFENRLHYRTPRLLWRQLLDASQLSIRLSAYLPPSTGVTFATLHVRTPPHPAIRPGPVGGGYRQGRSAIRLLDGLDDASVTNAFRRSGTAAMMPPPAGAAGPRSPEDHNGYEDHNGIAEVSRERHPRTAERQAALTEQRRAAGGPWRTVAEQPRKRKCSAKTRRQARQAPTHLAGADT